jgi:MFS family permease
MSPRRLPGRAAHRFGYVVVAVAFLLNMAFSAVPTPLYVLYQARDHFSDVMVTVVYAVYALGVVVSLFLAGHVSDWLGRRRVLATALLVNVASALLFVVYQNLAGLLVARVVSGLAVGITTATATAYLGELHRVAHPTRTERRPQMAAIAANLGGIGVGPLLAGALASFAPHPLILPYEVMGVALTIVALLVFASPETTHRRVDQARWRPQRVVVPRAARPEFFAATGAGFAAFAVYGVFNSLVPSFLAGTLHETSHVVAGAVAFSAFAAGALAQLVLSNLATVTMLRRGSSILLVGLGLFTLGMWIPSLTVFILGGVVTGAGAGMVFRGALVAAGTSSRPETRAEVLAGFFLGAYVGLSVPVIGLGVATSYAPAREVMLVFVVLVVFAILGSVRAVIRLGGLSMATVGNA